MLPIKSAGRVHIGGMHHASLPHSISTSSRLCNWHGQSRVSAQSNIAAVTTSGSSEPRSAVAHLCASALAAAMFGLAPAAHAIGPVSVKLNDITLTRVECSAGVSTVTGVTFSGSSGKAACLDVTATVDNVSGKQLNNADVFGRVYDAAGEAALDDTENIRVAYIAAIPPGQSRVAFRLVVPAEQYDQGPLKLVGFKATGFPGKNLPGQGSGLIDESALGDCEITGDCDELAAEAAIR